MLHPHRALHSFVEHSTELHTTTALLFAVQIANMASVLTARSQEDMRTKTDMVRPASILGRAEYVLIMPQDDRYPKDCDIHLFNHISREAISDHTPT